MIFFLILEQGCQTHFYPGPHQPQDCLQRAEIILGLYKCNYSLTVKELKLHSALWRQPRGWCGPQWKWVDTPALEEICKMLCYSCVCWFSILFCCLYVVLIHVSVFNPKLPEHTNRNYLDLSQHSANEPCEKTATGDLTYKTMRKAFF